jgi:hypothetical protein
VQKKRKLKETGDSQLRGLLFSDNREEKEEVEQKTAGQNW